MVKHVIFDVDGTIINGDYAWLNATQKTVRSQLGKEMSFAELTYTLGMPDDWIYTDLGVHDPVERTRIIAVQAEIFMSERHNNRYYDGILELFDALTARNIALGVVTSRLSFELEDPLWTAILPRFGVVVTGEMVKNLKPHPEPMEQYLARAGVDKADVVFVGDSRFDASCAKNADVPFALAMWGTHAPDLEAKYKPQHPMDLLDLI